MIIYCVTITVDADIEVEWLDWMRRIHVPDVVRTGCFSECRIYKVIESDAADRSYVIVVPIDQYTWTEGGAWWEVGVPEVSERAAVRKARDDWAANKQRQRVGV